MRDAAWIIGLSLVFQVPPPSPVSDPGLQLKESARSIREREARNLEGLAAAAGKGKERAAVEIRGLLPQPQPRDGASRIIPLPEVVPAGGRGLTSISSKGPNPASSAGAEAWRAGVEQARSKSAAEFLALARRAAATNPPHYALAGLALRDVLERQPNQPEARRLLGYVPHEGGWARPFAVAQLRQGLVNHPVFGWVPADWVAHLDAGERPAPSVRGQRKVRWLAADEADRLRSDWKHPWKIATEHFEVQTDVPLAEAIEFTRRLEAFYDLFFAIMADVVGESLPLARRFRSPSLTAEASYRPHQVYYFATKDEYVDHLRTSVGADIDQSLGYYNPPRPGRGNRAPAYFFRDLGGRLPVTATLYHEVSHQLLFETAGPNAYTRNAGNYWVFEGLGTYFETVTPRPDGSLEVGGMVGERLTEAVRSFAAGRFIPLDAFLSQDQGRFNRDERIHVNYQQAMALTVFLMQGHDQGYRDSFLDYVRDAYRGRIKLGTGRSLEDRLDQPLKVIDSQFRDFLGSGDAKQLLSPHRENHVGQVFQPDR